MKKPYNNLEALKSYFDNTPQDVLDADFMELKPLGEVGPDCIDVLNHWRSIVQSDILEQLGSIEPDSIVMLSIPHHRLIGVFKGVGDGTCMLHNAVSSLRRRTRTIWQERPVRVSIIGKVKVLNPSNEEYLTYLRVLDSIYPKREVTKENA
jgi:hypothetical protein|uniref:Uncharacterized protein n=1 Tax=Podoviridae sp. ctz6O13 TaxID=2827757 RepID=A0A8S5TKG0_9CAUD|nr:MAG TPA: hypothetical protein [Podoviridae sp. ctz6O13]